MITSTGLIFKDALSDPEFFERFTGMLKSEDLCYEDLEDISGLLQIAIHKDKVIGGYGLEIYGVNALFRSVVIDQSFRNLGLGAEIIKEAFSQSKKNKIESLYLLTTTADKFFLKHGFKVIHRNSVPESIGATKEFESFCPDTAICMKKDL